MTPIVRNPDVRLEAGLCVLRPWRADDLDALVRHADDPAVACNMRDVFPHPYTRADGESWLVLAGRPGGRLDLAIECDGEAVGGIGMIPGQDVQRVSAEIGYWLGRRVWGRGLATAAVRALTEHAFATTELTRLFALPFAHNAGSRRVLEKAGFVLEAVLYRSAVKQGRIIDQAQYARLRPQG